jgi:hypothetical protein
MAISKKDAKRAVAVLKTHVSAVKLSMMLESVYEASKNKSFRRSITRMLKVIKKLERPKNGRIKVAA